MDTAPPNYQTATSAANPGVRDTHAVDIKQQPPSIAPTHQNAPSPSTSSSAPPQSKHIFPPAFGFYHTSRSDLVIGFSADTAASQPLFYISTHGAFSSQPDVVLHSQTNSGSAPLATAAFHSFSTSIDISLFAPNNPGQLAYATKFVKEGAFDSTMSFGVPMPNGKVERFEWKRSSGPEVQSLQGKSHGMKLVRAGTREVCAAWAPPHTMGRKKGKMAFLGNGGDPRDEFGVLWEMMVVISILGSMEKARRRRRSNAAGAAGAAGAGGGGC